MSTNEFVDLSTVMNSSAYHRNSSGVGSYTNVHGQPVYNSTFPSTTNPYTPQQPLEKVENWPMNSSEPPAGFPQDDECSIQCNDGGSANLDIYYNNPFHQNEEHTHQGNTGQDCVYPLEHTPVLPGTTTGTILFVEDPELQIWTTAFTFVVNANGLFTFTTVETDAVWPTTGELNLNTGELKIKYNVDNPGQHKVIVSYESNIEAQPAVWGQQGQWSTFQNTGQDKNSSSYIDYLVNQLADTKARLYDVEEKLAAVHKENGGSKTLPELEVEMYNEYDKKLKEQREFMITKLDQFLKMKVKDEDDLKKMVSRPTVEIFEEALES